MSFFLSFSTATLTQDVVSKFHENHVKAYKLLRILHILLFLSDPEMMEMYAFQNGGSELSPAPNMGASVKSLESMPRLHSNWTPEQKHEV